MKVVTHNDRFHADDVFAMAVMYLVFGKENIEVIRTRDDQIIADADIVFDVGGIYDEAKNRFDHHQLESAGARVNGVPYASVGLVWKKWGTDICGSVDIAHIVDTTLIQSIDAGDNGYAFFRYLQDDIEVYTLNAMVLAFGSTWKEPDTYDQIFLEVVDIAEKILKREIARATDKIEAIPLVENAYIQAEDKRLIVLEEYYPWNEVLGKKSDVLFVVSPNKEKTIWRINTIQDELFTNRKNLPQVWGGLRDHELEQVTQVEGALFCHKNLFMAATSSKDSALKLAKKALEA